MSNTVVGRTSIAMELDDSQMLADMTEAERIIAEFTRRMTIAARVRIHRETNEFGKEVLRINVDPRTTEAGMEVIRKIVAEYTGRIEREANVTVGVRTTPIRTAMSRLRDFMAREGQSISDGIHFWMSRGLLKAARDLVKLPAEMIKESFSKFLVAEEATTKLAVALASTGEASGKSKQELVDFAKQLEKTTLIADQVTMGVQGILLTSEGLNGINFDRATRGALDLSAALGGDAATHAARLGKSLQDPVRGMEMLRDAGISFSQEQQDTIKFLAETNELASAQGILLDELESRFGGSADNTGSLNEKLKEQALNYENLQEKIGEVAAESVDSFIPAMEAGIDTIEALAPSVLGVTTVLAELATELVYTTMGIDGSKASVSSLIEETDRWIASIKSTVTMVKVLAEELTSSPTGADKRNWVANGQPDLMERTLDKMEKLTEREIKKREAQRERRRKQAEKDAEQAKEDWKLKQAGVENTQGMSKKDKDAALKQVQDAKDAVKRNKDEQAQKRKEEAEYARQDAEDARDHAKAVRDAEKAARDAAAAEKKAAREAAKALAKEESDEKKRLTEEDKKIAKEKADYEKSMGRDSLLALNERIQDARYLRRDEEKDKKSIEERAKENVAKRREAEPKPFGEETTEEKLAREKRRKQLLRGADRDAKLILRFDEFDFHQMRDNADNEEEIKEVNELEASWERAKARREELLETFKDFEDFKGVGAGGSKDSGQGLLDTWSGRTNRQREIKDFLKDFPSYAPNAPNAGNSMPLGSKLEVKQDEVVKAIKDQTTAIVRAVGPDVMGS